MRDYFLNVAPLNDSETFVLRQVVESFPPRAIKQAIDAESTGDERSFSQFLKALDGYTAQVRRGTPRSLISRLKRFWDKFPGS